MDIWSISHRPGRVTFISISPRWRPLMICGIRGNFQNDFYPEKPLPYKHFSSGRPLNKMFSQRISPTFFLGRERPDFFPWGGGGCSWRVTLIFFPKEGPPIFLNLFSPLPRSLMVVPLVMLVDISVLSVLIHWWAYKQELAWDNVINDIKRYWCCKT